VLQQAPFVDSLQESPFEAQEFTPTPRSNSVAFKSVRRKNPLSEMDDEGDEAN